MINEKNKIKILKEILVLYQILIIRENIHNKGWRNQLSNIKKSKENHKNIISSLKFLKEQWKKRKKHL